MSPKKAKKPKSKRRTAKRARPGHATLATLVETLGAQVIQILTAPKGLDVALSDPVIHDPTEPPTFEEGDVVLGVGLASDDGNATALIKTAGERKAAAVALKIREEGADVASLQKTADESGVALLAVQPEMTWNQLFSLLRTSIASAGTVPDSGAAGTPIGDLFALANAVAAMVGGPSTIEDPQSRVLAYSSLDDPIDAPRRQTILGRRVPEAWMKRLQEAGIFQKLWSSEDPIEIQLPYKGLRPRLAVAVKAGGEILGSIWVQEGNKPLGDDAKVALREAAQIAALHMIRHSVSEDLERRLRGELLRSVLEGRAPVEQLAGRLGLEANSPFTAVVFEMQDLEEADGLLLERARDLVALYLESFHRRAVCTPIGNSIFALVPSSDESGVQLVSLCRRIVDGAASSLKVKLSAGIGSTVPRLGLARRSREEADRVLRVLANKEGSDLASIDEVRAESILVELQDLAVERPELKLGKLLTLREHDAEHNTDYVRTLRAYFDAFGDITQAAAAVNVHANTFRYRIRRLCEISGIDLDNPSERLVTELQLRLL